MAPSNRSQLIPSSFVARWKQRSKEDFLASFGDTLMLLIRVEDASAQLAIALEAAFSGLGDALKPTVSGIEFATATSPTGRRDSEAARGGQWGGRTLLAQRLAQSTHFVAPLRKRRGAERPFQERITVGRTQNSDIVLRHPSVSKFHAWFECDGDGHFYLFDAGSKNHTTLNDLPLMARIASHVRPGDEILFGGVETVLCSPAPFWDTITTV